MEFLKRCLAVLFSRQMLVYAALALAAAAIWFIGPLLAVGAAHPLASDVVRAVIIAVLVFLLAACEVFRFLRRSRANDSLLRKLLNFGGQRPEVVARDELAIVDETVQKALRQLKGMRSGGGIGRILEGRRYLYELPWYMVVGVAGAGKTTALLNAGLQFPLPEQMGAAMAGKDRGTRTASWWLSNEAVLIDTAGRYASHDQNPKVDQAEWIGFLAMLRRHRSRAPINGAVLAISAEDLLTQPPEARVRQAASLRARLADLRADLGIRFPVYVIVTKLDQLAGFGAYFQYLSSEGRAQPWGFTFPHDDRKARRSDAPDAFAQRCRTEMALLVDRLQAGLDARLYEEYDPQRRKDLFALPQEFAGLAEPIVDMLAQVFLDSRFDDTESTPMLRGVYFTSAAQTSSTVVADHETVLRRLERNQSDTTETAEHAFPATEEAVADSAAAQLTGHRSYFLQDVFKRVIVTEAHLVKPNLRWEFRFRLLRLLGHTLAVVIFLWLAAALYTSDGHNRAYLQSVRQKAGALAATVTAFYKAPQPGTMPEVLSAARDLPAYAGLALADPPLAWRYGLYSVPPVLDASMRTHVRLQDNLLVPYLVRRVEAVLESAVAARDARQTYDTLRVYLMLHEQGRFSAAQVRAWVQSDWAAGNGAAAFGGRVAVLEHLDGLLDGSRPVHSPYARNEALIRSARDFLDGNTSIERLYDRAKAAMLDAAPQDFTLVRAVGPQAGTVFTRASGEPLERGIPGLFTHAGYHDLFNARLPEFVGKAQAVDAWVMGRTGHDGAQKKTLEAAAGKLGDIDPLTRAIRRLYLEEYARRWIAFLGDIRTVTGNNLAFDLEILRNFAAPDSPLARLGRAAVQETTLSRPLAPQDPSLAQKALSVLDKTPGPVQALNARAEARQERELVDNRFAALREVVTGQADAAAPHAQAAGAKPRLDAIAGMVNAYYTTLVVANNALNTRNLPPPADTGAQLRMEAAKLPAPFAAVLADLVVQGTRDVNKGIGEILVAQMDAVIGESCRSAIEGKYPFAPATARDVDPEDFARIFAAGGVLDDFFQKVLAPHVDTTISPWRYKLTAPDVPPVAGPSLVPFQRARDIREVFFGDPGAKRLAWKVDLKVVGLDPEIVELNLDFDGQGQRYVHGPAVPLKITWPGPRGGQSAQISASPRIRPETSTLAASGPWALMRVVARGKLAGSASASHFMAEYDFDGRKARLDINTGSLANPWTTGLLQGFECPGRSGS